MFCVTNFTLTITTQRTLSCWAASFPFLSFLLPVCMTSFQKNVCSSYNSWGCPVSRDTCGKVNTVPSNCWFGHLPSVCVPFVPFESTVKWLAFTSRVRGTAHMAFHMFSPCPSSRFPPSSLVSFHAARWIGYVKLIDSRCELACTAIRLTSHPGCIPITQCSRDSRQIRALTEGDQMQIIN